MSRRIKKKTDKSSNKSPKGMRPTGLDNNFMTESLAAYSKNELLKKKVKGQHHLKLNKRGMSISTKMTIGAVILVMMVIGGVFEGELDDYLVNRSSSSQENDEGQIPDLSSLSCEEIIEIVQERRGGGEGFGGGDADPSEFDGERGERPDFDLDPEIQACVQEYFQNQQP